MRYPSVHWSEGMFLRPHHFQAADRYWAEQLAASQHWDHTHGYGLRSIEFSAEAIANQQFQLIACEIRLRDGTLLSLAQPDRVDLRDALAEQAAPSADMAAGLREHALLRIYLGVPSLRLGRANTGARDADDHQRYVVDELTYADETTGSNDQSLGFKAPRVRLFVVPPKKSPPDGYECLPIAQIKRAGDEKAAPQLDPEYIPPLLATDAWPGLQEQILRAIYDRIGQKITVLSQHVVNRRITLAAQDPHDGQQIMMLMILNQAYGILSSLLFARGGGVHPFTAYAELCRIVGQLSIFLPQRRPPEFPPYDHDNLGYIFRWVKDQIDLILDTADGPDIQCRFFIGAGRGMHVTFEPPWLGGDWKWYIGVHWSGLSVNECRDLLSPGKLNWKLGSSRQVDEMFTRAIPGLALRPLAQAPRALPNTTDWLFFDITRGNPAWQDVEDSCTLAMRFNEQLIGNQESLRGQQEMLVRLPGKQAKLEVALFVLPPSK